MKLNNSNRADAMRSILQSMFEEKFADLRKRIEAILRERVEQEHPAFIAALKDPAIRPYLYVADRLCPKYGIASFATPNYHQQWERTHDLEDVLTRPFRSDVNGMSLWADVTNPCTTKVDCTITDEGIIEDYTALWAGVIAARDAIRTTLNSYTTHAALHKDFPDLADHFKMVVAAKKGELAIPVGTLHEQLVKAGVVK